MRAQGWKVPPVLAVAVLTWACGGNAESAPDHESERVIPAAEEAPPPSAPEDGAAAVRADEAPEKAEREAEPSPDVRPSAPPVVAPQEREARSEPAARTEPVEQASQAADRDEPISTPPTTVVRTDPEPSVAPDEPMRTRPEPRPEPLAVLAGTRIPLVVEDELSTRVSRAGDVFDAVVDEDVLGASGVVLLPRGTRVRGRVVESLESPGPDQPATLALAVERVELADRLVPLAATVVELEHETEARDSDARTAAKVGAGAVAGAILGKIIGGDGKDALKGAVAGAAAGAAVAHATRDGHAMVPRGARMVIVLDRPLVVEQSGL